MALLLTKGLRTPSFQKNGTQVISPIVNDNIAVGGIREGSSLKDVKIRMKSVKAIQKITKTMKMIASSRLREAQNSMERTKPFASSLTKIYSLIGTTQQKDAPAPPKIKKRLFVTITSDRGLCGAINSSVVRTIRATVRENPDVEAKIVNIGNKGIAQLTRDQSQKILLSVGDTGKKPLSFSAASLIAERVIEIETEQITLIYNKFNTVISYNTTEKDLDSFATLMEKKNQIAKVYEFEDGTAEVTLKDLSEYAVGASIHGALVENSAVEISARMTAMDSSSRNAGEMLKKLSILYNRKRQAAITTELIEIVSGANAIDSTRKAKD